MSITSLTLFKRSNGYYYISYLEDGRVRWKSTRCTHKQDALKALCNLKEHLKKRPSSMLFTDFVKQFTTAQAFTLRQSTIDRIYKPAFDAFISVCSNKSLSSYTLKDVERFKHIVLEKFSATYVNILFRSLRAAFNLAVKWQLLQENPFLKSSQVKVPEKLPVYLTKEDFQRLMASVKEQELKEVYVFAALTGLRLGEILNLEWNDVDFQRRLILITNKETSLTKTGKSRTVPLNDMVYEALARRKIMQTVTQWIFHRQGYKLTESYVSHKFKRYVRLLGLNEAVHFHSLRHTFATWLVQDGVSIYEVQKLLGHSSVKVTEVYSHLAASELHRAVNKITVTLN